MASRSIDIRRLALLLLPLALSACAPTRTSPPAAVPPPSPAPVQQPVHSGDWRDWPLTPGTWRYVPGTPISSARYAEGAAVRFVVQCDAASRRVTLMRAGPATEIVITTSTRAARFPAGHVEYEGAAMAGVILTANDGFLDVMAFSRGRIAVQSPGLPPLAIPTWAEPARAVEDCRK